VAPPWLAAAAHGTSAPVAGGPPPPAAHHTGRHGGPQPPVAPLRRPPAGINAQVDRNVQHLAQRVQHPCQSHSCPALSYSHFVNNSVAKGFNTQAHRIQLGLISLLHPAGALAGKRPSAAGLHPATPPAATLHPDRLPTDSGLRQSNCSRQDSGSQTTFGILRANETPSQQPSSIHASFQQPTVFGKASGDRVQQQSPPAAELR